MTRIRTLTVCTAAVVGLAACQEESPTGLDTASDITTVAGASASTLDDSPTYAQDAKALIGKFTTPPLNGYPEGLDVIYEVSVDQLRYRNGNSHKAWFIPQSSKGLIVFVRDRATGQGITNSAPNIQIPPVSGFCPGSRQNGSFSFTDEQVPFTCDWKTGNGPNRVDGTFDLRWKRGGPGAKAINNTSSTLDNPQITVNAGTLKGSFNFNGTDYDVSILYDRVKFRNGSSHREYVIPESHKLDDGGFGAAGGGYRVTCPFKGPGLDTVGGNESITCTWKAGNGDRPSGTVVLS